LDKPIHYPNNNFYLYFTILFFLSFVSRVCSHSSFLPQCYQYEKSWANNTILDLISPVSDASECRKLCKNTLSTPNSEECIAWTFATQNNQEIPDTCLLFARIGAEIPFPDSVSGERSCACSDNYACKRTLENEISFYENILMEETCQDYCSHTSGCEFYTWYDSSEVLTNLCFLLSSCDEKFFGCTGCFSAPADCDAPPPKEQAIIITGGSGATTSAEVLATNGTSLCSIKNMPQYKDGHTQTGLSACGGFNKDTRKNCIHFYKGSWIDEGSNLFSERAYHSSWKNQDGDTLLIGGFYSLTSTEIVHQNGSSTRSFDLPFPTWRACSIELPEMFIVTGGSYTLTKASRYTSSGWQGNLPDLNEGRYHHGCAYFFNGNRKRVFLVAGGYDSSYITSTELLAEGDNRWTLGPPLPNGRRSLQGVSLSNAVIMTGGYNGSRFDDVLRLDTERFSWKKVGSMKEGRSWHGASLVNIEDVVPFCN